MIDFFLPLLPCFSLLSALFCRVYIAKVFPSLLHADGERKEGGPLGKKGGGSRKESCKKALSGHLLMLLRRIRRLFFSSLFCALTVLYTAPSSLRLQSSVTTIRVYLLRVFCSVDGRARIAAAKWSLILS